MAAVTFDAVGAGVTVSGATAAAASYSHTISGNAVVGIVGSTSTTNPNVVTMTCGGVAMPQIGTAFVFDTTSGIISQLGIFGLLNPPTGAQTMAIVNTGPGSTWYNITANSVSYNNVGSFGTLQTASSGGASSTALSQAVTSAANHMVIQAFGKNTNVVSTAPNQTIRWNIVGATGGGVSASNVPIQDAAGSPSFTFSCTDTANPKWGAVAVDLIPPVESIALAGVPNRYVGPMALRNRFRRATPWTSVPDPNLYGSASTDITVGLTAGGVSDWSPSYVTRDPATGNLMLGGMRYRFAGCNGEMSGLSESTTTYGETVTGGLHVMNHAAIDDFITAAVGMNARVVRIFMSGMNAAGTFMPTMNNYDHTALEGVDYAIQQLTANNIKLIAALSDDYDYYGGGKFKWCTQSGVTPDANAHEFFTNATVVANFKAYVNAQLNHVNVYTGVAYKDDPVFLAWETGNEISDNTDVNALLAWTLDLVRYIKVDVGAKQLILDGKWSILAGNKVPEAYTNNQYIDIYTEHTYDQYRTPAHMANQAAIAHNYGKAFIVGEYPLTGLNQSGVGIGWGNTDMIAAVEGNANIDGDLFWSLFPQGNFHGGGYCTHYPGDDATMIANVTAQKNHSIAMAGATLTNATAPTKTATLISPEIDVTKWTARSTANITGGQIILPTGDTAYSSAVKYDLSDSSVTVELVQKNPGTGASDCGMYVQNTPAPYGTPLYAIIVENSFIRYRQESGGVSDVSETYDPIAHRWLRIRTAPDTTYFTAYPQTSGTVYFETSADGIHWVVKRTMVSAMVLTSVYAVLFNWNYGGDGTSGTAIFDNFNNAPPPDLSPAVNIPNRYVGPVALRQLFRRSQPWTIAPDPVAVDVVQTWTDPVGVTDSVATAQDWVLASADLVGLTDSISFDLTRAQTDPVGVTDSVATVQDWVRSQTDFAGVADSITLDVGRTQTDPVGVTDSVATAQDWVRSQTDLAGVADSIVLDVGRTQTDPVGVIDSVATVQDWVRTQADLAGVADSITLDVGRTQADPVSVTDSVATVQDWVRSQTDLVGVADSITLDVGRTQTDPVGVTDSVGTVQAWVRVQTDLVGLADSATFDLGGIVSGLDLVGVGDAVSTTQDWVRSQTDLAGVADSASKDLGRTQTDLAGVTDSIVLDVGRTQTDPVGVTDSVVMTQDWVRAQTDLAGVTDSASKDLGRTQTDLAGVTDSVATVQDWVRSQTDLVGVADSITLDVGRTQTDPVGVSDSVVTTQDWVRSQTDLAGVADSISKDLGQTRTDLAGVSDSVGTTQNWVRSQIDSVGLADSITLDLGRTSTDSAGLADSVGTTQDWVRSQTDSTVVIDSISLVLSGAGAVAVIDQFAVDDSLTTVSGNVRVQSDPVGLGDSATFDIGFGRQLVDSVSLVDNVGTVQDWVRQPVDPVGLIDALAFQSNLVRALGDPVGVADSATFELGVVRVDPVRLGDDFGRLAEYVQALSDSVGLADSATFQRDSVYVVDAVRFGDSIRFLLSGARVPDRTVTIFSENRTVEVLAENRISSVLFENRVVEARR